MSSERGCVTLKVTMHVRMFTCTGIQVFTEDCW